MDLRVGEKFYVSQPSELHRHKVYEIVVFRRGSGDLRAGDLRRPVRAGDIFVAPPGIMHHTTPRDDLECIYIQGDHRGIFTFREPVVISDNETGDGLALAEMIFRSRYESGFAESLVVALSHFIVQHLHSDDALTISVRQTVAQMGKRFHDPDLDLAALLRESGYAEDYIRAGFKRVMGMTPTAFLIQMRIRHACYLIDTFRNTLSLSEIGERCGYVDYVMFSKKFKEVMGMSPRAYKKDT